MGQEKVEEMKEFMTLLMEVKVSMAELNGKVDKIINIEEKVNATYDTAIEAKRRSADNEKDIEKKADKDDVERIIKDKDNWKKNLPAWVAVVVSLIALIQ